MRRAFLAGLVVGSLLAIAGRAQGNLRAPRTRREVPSSAAGPPAGELHARVLHENLTFRCHGDICRVVASYLIESDRAAEVDLEFILPVKMPVNARLGSTPVPVSLTSVAAAGFDIEKQLRLSQRYSGSEDWPTPTSFRAVASVPLQTGGNEITFDYDQALGALERDYGYFHEGRMVQHCSYVLWPLREWSRARDFAIDLRIEVDRAPPSWWKRTFGHPTNVSCRKISGERAQVGNQLVFRARIGDPFPDYLDCELGDDDLVYDTAK